MRRDPHSQLWRLSEIHSGETSRKGQGETKLSHRDAISQVITQGTAQTQSHVPQQRPVPSGQSVEAARPRI